MNKEKLLNILIKQGFSFSFLKESDISAHKEFAKRHWPSSPKKADFAYNTWKFSKREHDTINMIVSKYKDVVVGQGAGIQFKAVIKGVVYDCAWGCNFMIDEEYKNVGLGAAIDIFAMNNHQLIITNNATKEAGKYKHKLGWQELEGPTTFFFAIKVSDLVKIKRFKKSIVTIIDLGGLVINPIWKAFNYLRLTAYNEKRWENTTLEKILDRITSRRSKFDVPYILHDKQFFDWRTNKYAGKELKFLSSRSNDSYVVYNVSGNRISVLEHFFETKEDFGAYLKLMLKKESNSNIGLMKIFANTDFEHQLFESFLFKPLKTKNNFNVYSTENLFEGIKKMHCDIYDGDGLLS